MAKNAVLILVSSLSAGGAERVSCNLASYLSNNGFDAHLLVAQVNDDYPLTYPVDEKVHIHYSPTGTRRKLARVGINSVLLNYLMATVKPNWVISLGSQYPLLNLWNIFERSEVILSERNYPDGEHETDEKFKKVEDYLSRAQKVVFQTAEIRDCFSRDIVEKSFLIPNAVPESGICWQGSDSKEIAFSGRLVPQKRVDVAIRGFAIFHDSHPDYSLHFYGEGPCKADAEALARDLGVGQCVCFHGRVSDVQTRVAKSRMYISTSDYEGISNSMLEALVAGVPTICTDCDGGGARLMINNGNNGFLIEKGDFESLARCMALVAEDDCLVERISMSARQSMDGFTETAIYSKWIDVLLHRP